MKEDSVMLRLLIVFHAVMTLSMGFTYSEVFAKKPTIMKGCKNCHEAEPNRGRGKLVSYSPKFSSLHVNVGPLVWIIKYDENTKLTGADSLDTVKKGKEMSVVFSGDENNPLANVISIKKPFKLPEEKLISVEEMKKLVLAGPKQRGYLLVDSRPPDAYNSGHLPGAISLPYPKLKKMKDKALPADKDVQIIFYCGGFS
jgi:hypothetical protein